MFIKTYLYSDCTTLSEIRRFKQDDVSALTYEELVTAVRPLLFSSCCPRLRQLEDDLLLFYLDEDFDWVRFVGEKEWRECQEYITATKQQGANTAAPFSLKLRVLPASACAAAQMASSAEITGIHSLNGTDADQKIRDRAAKARHTSSGGGSRSGGGSGGGHRQRHSGGSKRSGSSSSKKHASIVQEKLCEVAQALSLDQFCGDMSSSLSAFCGLTSTENVDSALTADTLTSSSSDEDEEADARAQHKSSGILDEEDGEFVIVKSGCAGPATVSSPSSSLPSRSAAAAAAAAEEPSAPKEEIPEVSLASKQEGRPAIEQAELMPVAPAHAVEQPGEIAVAAEPAAPVFQLEPEPIPVIPALQSEEELQLAEMGFNDAERNKALLQQYGRDVIRVVAMLLE